MNKKIPLLLSILLIFIGIVLTFNLTYVVLNERHKTEMNTLISRYSGYNEIISIDEIVRKNYYGKIDEKELNDYIMRGYVAGLGDDYADYFTEEEYNNLIAESDGTSIGIGIIVTNNKDEDALEILTVLENSPADKSGIMPGDIIVGVDGENVVGLGYYQTLYKVRGDIDTTVSITVKRDGNEYEYSVKRAEFFNPSVTYKKLNAAGDIGFIRLNEFNSSTPKEFREAFESLKNEGIKSIVFDLRNNGGGDLSSIIEILDMILPEGPITHIYFGNGEEKHYTSDAESLKDYKIAVLVNSNTASAAELFTSAIKDYSVQGNLSACIIGVNTYGKGVLQTYYRLSSGGALKITVGRYDPPYSENYDGKGITPDRIVELSEEQSQTNFYKLTEGNDDQLAEAIKYITEK